MYRYGKFAKAGDQTHQRYVPDEKDLAPPPDYEKAIPIGTDINTGELVSLSISNKDRIGIFGNTGSGKTRFIKVFVSRLWKGGYKILHCSDVKNDFQDLDNRPGASKKIIEQSGFAPGEKRQPIPKEMFMPRFLYHEYPEHRSKPSYLTPYALGFRDVSTEDFRYLLNPSSTAQENLITNMMSGLKAEQLSYQTLYELVHDTSNNQQLSQAVESSIEAVQNQSIINDTYRKDPLEYLDDNVVVLALENWERYKYSGKERVEMFIANVMRRAREQLRDGDLEGPLLMVIDEAHVFVKNGADSISKQEAVDTTVLGRGYGIPMIYSTQKPSQIPNSDDKDTDNIVGEMSYLFLAPNLDEDDWKTALRATNLYNPNRLQKWRDLFQSMPEFSWLMVDKAASTYRVIDPLAPLCAHTG
ncbi:ATP-binding protein [Halogeometricum borinquense]|uniref:ATP-binding protein n=1 Tax=Halogeometricum borinquense TaxID=60847 RepID=A0A6C0UII3_9EURY|nr:DUF87 domain-containing protein [Halogeometricum borinquense]QIB75374.1 ATP-binding protein [Halogeometricum borinquense]